MTRAIKGEAPRKSVTREILEWAICLAVAFAVYAVVHYFLFTMVRVDGDSMRETLHDGERMLATIVDVKINGPRRFDVVICEYPNPVVEGYRVKRVIALPGETVEVRDSVTYIDGEPLAEPFIERARISDYGPLTVPEGHYFVMGDNRNNSSDSTDPRVGPLAREKIVAKARVVWWPLDQFRIIE